MDPNVSSPQQYVSGLHQTFFNWASRQAWEKKCSIALLAFNTCSAVLTSETPQKHVMQHKQMLCQFQGNQNKHDKGRY
jgi:hypothetical protein